MHKKQLESIKHHVTAALQGSNWQGIFTPEIRTATVEHRQANIARHLEIALNSLEIELKHCDKKIDKRRERKAKQMPVNYRAPYKDD